MYFVLCTYVVLSVCFIADKDQTVIFHRTPEPSTFPGPPSRPAIKDVRDTSMRLEWKANPNHGTSPVHAYVVEYFSHETREVTSNQIVVILKFSLCQIGAKYI